MPTYLYRCIVCGFETDIHSSPAPNHLAPVIEDHEHPAGALGTSRVLCDGPLKRVWEAPRANLGYREAHHTQNERHLFTHKI
jgi:hypothetical protein